MILSASKISGYNYTATPTLGTIAEPICWFDWRFGRTDGNVVGGALRVNSLNDLSPNNFLLEARLNRIDQPMVLSDGLGMDDTIGTKAPAVFRRNGSNSKYEIFHKGNPFLIMAVVKPIIPASNLNFFGTNSSNTTSVAGLRFRANAANNRLELSFRNDAGTLITNVVTPNNSVPTGDFLFIAAQYYGGGTGSNNLKIWINNTQYTFTANPTFGTGTCPELCAWQGAGGTVSSAYEFSQKLAIAYNLTGKTSSEIDDFRTLAITTLKRDPEYSSLTTP
jgi:hypothetical protein